MAPGHPSPAAGRRHILYCEDEPSIALLYRIGLEAAGYRVTIAGDGRSGVQAARDLHPDLILMDYHLPDSTGIDALRALRADAATAAIPVLLLSNDDTPGVVREARDAGATDVLTKILWRPPKLIAALSQWLPAEQPPG